MDEFNEDRIALTDQFLVKADTVGARAVDNIKAGIGRIMICSEVDNNWKCLNESTTSKANTSFNLYIVMPERIPGQTTGWMIYKANADGSDAQCVDQLLQGTNGPARYWATTNGNVLLAGSYNIYSVNWTTRTTSGNMKEYLGKTTLVVK